MDWSIIEIILIGISGVIIVSMLPIINYTLNRENKINDKGD